jgi:phenylacetyl-CoA:acceptor oxidoreductase
VLINKRTASDSGSRPATIEVTSVIASTRGAAVPAGIRPDTLVIIGQFDHWATPYAKTCTAELNTVAPMSIG